MGLKVHGFVGGTTATVLLSLYEKNVTDFELVIVNFLAGEQRHASHLAKQPFGKIPVLEDEDLTIFESRGIVRYVADKYAGQGTDLYPKNLKDRAVVDQWMEVESQNLSQWSMNIAYERFYAPNIFHRESNLELIATSLEKLCAALDIYDQRLASSEYLAGDFFSLADVLLMPACFGMPDFFELVQSRKHLRAWWEKVSARPASKRYEAQASQFWQNLPGPPA